LGVFTFVPKAWFDRMGSLTHYEDDGSATSRIDFWRASLRIAANNPFVGGGFNVTLWPNALNPLLQGTDIPKYDRGRAAHSSYFEVLSEHGWVGLALFLMIGAYSWRNCSWLIRRSRGRPDLAWANLLGRMGQAAIVGYSVAGAFASLAYLDEYWAVLFIFDATRRIVARQTAPAAGTFAMRLRERHPAIGVPAMARSDRDPGFVKGRQ
jgi:probable O-glycosylation ligase (exosortase A-associated)